MNPDGLFGGRLLIKIENPKAKGLILGAGKSVGGRPTTRIIPRTRNFVKLFFKKEWG